MKNNLENKKGFTLVEVLVTVFIFSLILVAITSFQADIFGLNRIIRSGLINQQEAKKIVRPFSNEVRGSTGSALGGYPIQSAESKSLIFFTDTNGDNIAERIRYFWEEGDFKKGIIEPDPTTYQYNEEDETIIKTIHDVIENDIFYYYDSSYDGTELSTALSYPVTSSDIRMIKVVIEIDSDPNNPPAPFIVTTQVSLRNLKDNL